MSRYSYRALVCEKIHFAVTFSSVSLTVICAELSNVSLAPTSVQSQTNCPSKSIRLWKLCSGGFAHSKINLKAPGYRRWNGQWVLTQRAIPFFCHTEPKNCESLTEKACDLISLLLLDLLIIQGFKEDVQDQYVFSGETRDRSTPKTVLFLVYIT